MSRRLIVAATGLVVAALVAPTQAQDRTQALTLQAALDEALAQNPELIALRRQFEAMAERPAQERSLAPPMLEARIWQWPLNTPNPADATMYMFGLGQPIPGRGKRALREAVAVADAERARADITIRAREVVAAVKRTWADLLLARQSLSLHRDTEAVLQQAAEVTQVRYAAGRGPQSDVVLAMVELTRYHDHLITLTQEEQLAAARLNSLLDRPPHAPVETLPEPREWRLTAPPEVLQDLALSNQPELVAARLDLTRADARLAVAARDYAPDFFAEAGYMLMPDDRDAWMGTFGITWNRAPWSRGRLDARAAEAAAEVDAARARLAVVENNLRLAVQEAYVRVKAAEQRTALVRTTLEPQTVQAVSVAQIAYAADRGSFEAMLAGERLRLDAAVEYYEAVSATLQALADLERALGTEIPPAMLRAVAPLGERNGS